TGKSATSVGGDGGGDLVLLVVGEGEVADAAHQDREDPRPPAAVEAVAGEGADSGQGAGLGPAVAGGGGAVHAVGDGPFVAGKRQVLDEFFAHGRLAHRLQEPHHLRRGGAVAAGQAGAVDCVDPRSLAVGEALDDFGARLGRAGAAEVGTEQLCQHLGEEVVGVDVGSFDQL